MAVVGWILLGILALFFLLLLLVLFFPVSYRLEAEKAPGRLRVKAGAKWLFGLLGIVFSYPEPGEPEIRAAWFSLDRRKGGKEKRPGRRNRKGDREDVRAPEKDAGEEADGRTEREAGKEKDAAAAASDAGASLKVGKEDASEGAPEKAQGDENPSGEAKGMKKKRSSKGKKEGGKASGRKPAELYRKFRAELEFYRKLWQREETKALAFELLARLLKIFRHMLPQKTEGKVRFGAASPDITGYVLAVYGIASVNLPNLSKRLCLEFTPDFENEVLEGELLIRGRVTLAVLLWNLLRAVSDKRLRKLWRKIERHIS